MQTVKTVGCFCNVLLDAFTKFSTITCHFYSSPLPWMSQMPVSKFLCQMSTERLLLRLLGSTPSDARIPLSARFF